MGRTAATMLVSSNSSHALRFTLETIILWKSINALIFRATAVLKYKDVVDIAGLDKIK